MNDDTLDLIHQARKMIFANGFRPIPVLTPNSSVKGAGKRPAGSGPGFSRWQHDARQEPPFAVATKPVANATNTGVSCDGLRPVDIDVNDRALAAVIELLARDMLGDAPKRHREDSPRLLLLYRAAEGEPAHREVTEDETVAAAAGRKPYAVEILGRGNQFVAIGRHPDGAFLDWTDGRSPLAVLRDDLPVVTEAQIDDFLSAVGELLGAKKSRQNPVFVGQVGDDHSPIGGSGGFVARGGGDTAFADVLAALAVISGDGGSYQLWINVGQAIHSATGGSHDGLEAWDEWSKKSPIYNPGLVQEKWRTFQPRSISFGTLVHMARDADPTWRAPSWKQSDISVGAGHSQISVDILNRNTLPAPSLPVSVFGPDWGAWMERAADVANAPVDYVALPLLSAASALIGNARWTQNWDGWKEPPILWCASVGEPSSCKTPGAKTVIGLLRPVETHMGVDFDETHATWEEQAARARAEKKEWEKTFAEAIAAGEKVAPMPRSVVPIEPMRPVATVTSVTIEKMVEMLAAQPKGFLLAYDELAGWLGNMSRYSSGTDRPFWLEVWSGGPYRVDRKTSSTVSAPYMSCAVFGTIQPDRLNTTLKGIDDGLSSRFLWALPESRIFSKPRGTLDVMKARTALCRLADLKMHVADDGSVEPNVVPATDEAADLLTDFARDMQRREPYAAGSMKGTLGKARGHALRLSLVLEFLWWSMSDRAEPTQISTTAMRAAIRMMSDYFLPMAERVYGDAASTPKERDARALARWIAAERPNLINVRRLSRGQTGNTLLPGLRDAKDISEAVGWLRDLGWFDPTPVMVGGRPRSDYRIVPGLWAAIDEHTCQIRQNSAAVGTTERTGGFGGSVSEDEPAHTPDSGGTDQRLSGNLLLLAAPVGPKQLAIAGPTLQQPQPREQAPTLLDKLIAKQKLAESQRQR